MSPILNEQDLIDVLGNYQNASYFVGVAIPTKKLQNVRVEFSIPTHEKIIAIVDGTVFGSSKIGLAFGLSAIYAKNDWTVETMYRDGYLSYEDLTYSEISIQGKNVFLSNDCMVNLAGSSMKPNLLSQILQDLQYFLKTTSPTQARQNTVNTLKNVKEQKASVEFMVAKEGQQFGPYSVSVINQMLQSGQLNEMTSYVWKQGMTQWELIAHRQEFTRIEMNPPQIPPAIVYLDVPFNINEAQEHDLLTLPGVNVNLAKRIVDYRRGNGQITTYQTLRELLHVQPHEFEKIKSMVIVPGEKMIASSGRVIDF